ncbi:uncharacterized protein GIQ15_01383 [Arthroderma uncinatum]|uniref:uncharacterized protein n=1 Tax=Arthroderma uncinatum TaxID=74035 RepID=UPI00144A8151|nr:uncharacterized protein GIQ15_01383 [Arthroderma uncinatum]KAF3491866.1 hypothetical protein GIQ15_01383 [Arthroderma uncinatum]
MPSHESPSVIPAQISFLAIFNPSLGKTDETLQDQIVFYYSAPNQTNAPKDVPDSDTVRKDASEEENKRLRHVGLAQGMVSFAKNFSNGEPVDAIETENSRIVLKELEPGWWILASIDLTKISTTHKSHKNAKYGVSGELKVEYSSRELSPPYLLTQQLSKAYSIFLIHHGTSLEDLYKSLPRKSFCIYLERFWTRFVWNWDILLNGNPAIDLFSSMKLAGGGELGIGVGEEEWGSGEREVLEGFISRTEGLVDMIVSRFGDAPKSLADSESLTKKDPVKPKASLSDPTWLGCMASPGPHDGVMFSGTGALSRKSLTHVSQWMEWVYRYGEDAYGVRDDPRSTRRRKRGRRRKGKTKSVGKKPEYIVKSPSSSRCELPSQNHDELSPRIPPPLIVASDKKHKCDPEHGAKSSKASDDKPASTPAFGTDKLMNIITLGYGSAWGNSSAAPPSNADTNSLQPQDMEQNRQSNQPLALERAAPESTSARQGSSLQQLDESPGRFIIGLRDPLENEENDSESIDDEESPKPQPAKHTAPSKIIMRTLELMVQTSLSHEGDSSELVSKSLQVVIYLYQPFMFTFLFEPGTTALSSTSFYRSIHHQLGPLQKPLLSSTSPSKVAERLSRYDLHQYPRGQSKPSPGQSLYDIIYEPFHQTIRTSIPNIPEPDITSDHIRAYNNPKDASQQPQWTRADALNVYMQIINTYTETRLRPSELERICKTNRGWWVLWMRLPTTPDQPGPGIASSDGEGSGSRSICSQATGEKASKLSEYHRHPEGQLASSNVAFLVRKASDSKQPARGHLRSASGPGFFRSLGGGFGRELEGWSATPGKLVEGVGLDAKKYVDALINLNR